MDNPTESLKLVRAGNGSGDGRSLPEDLIREDRARLLSDLLHKHHFFPLWDRQVLDLRSGRGEMLAMLLSLGAHEPNLFGVERVPLQAQALRHRFPDAHVFCEPLDRLAFHDERFDLIVCSELFSKLPDEESARDVAREVRRVLQPGGCVLWYDLRYPSLTHRWIRPYSQRRIRSLFPRCTIEVRPCTVLPRLLRRIGSLGPSMYDLFKRGPLTQTHYTGLIVPL